MTICFLWGLIVIFISFYIFRQYNRVRETKKENHRERLNEKLQELLDSIARSKKRAASPENESPLEPQAND